jgi:hypothetical protein
VTTIRARCPNCGEVDMAPDAIELALNDDEPGGSYRFICPACMALVQRRADERIADLLVSIGVNVTRGRATALFDVSDLPEEAGDAALPGVTDGDERHGDEPPGHGLPFTYDDLISFHFLLADDDWVARAAYGRDGPGRGASTGP